MPLQKINATMHSINRRVLAPQRLLVSISPQNCTTMHEKRAATAAWKDEILAAEQREDSEAMFNVGMAYHRGDDGAPKQDVTEAKKWLQRSAESGHPRAQAVLGRIVYDEMEALRNLAQAHDYQACAEAQKWLTRASQQGEASATRTLIPLYITKGDLATALQTLATWLRQSLVGGGGVLESERNA